MLSGVILAGGRNRRMSGRNKALLTLDGETILERQLRAMQGVCSEVLIVTHEPEMYRAYQERVRIVEEAEPRIGPLGGLSHGLRASQEELVWVLACDIPIPSREGAVSMGELLMRQKELDAVIPWIEGRHQMLHSIYRRSCLEVVEALVREEESHRLSGLLDRLHWIKVDEQRWHEWGIEPSFVMDVDTPEQYHLALKQFENKST